MVRVTPPIQALNGGEFSPELYGRNDIEKYRTACRTMRNFIATVQGPATRRPGTRFVAATRNNADANLFPFEFSTEQAYIIEATEGFFRFYRNLGRIESGGGIIEIATPYTTDMLDELKYCQSADTMFITHPAVAPRKLTRASHVSWSIVSMAALLLDGPYFDVNTTGTTLAPSATSGNITITASAVTGINDGQGWLASDVNRPVRIQHGSTWGWARITSRVSTTVVNAAVVSAFGAATATSEWRIGAFSEASGWPTCATFFEERLCFAGTPTQPQTIWMSETGNFESFAPSEANGTVVADNAITVTISDDRVNAIKWLSSGTDLQIGTVGGTFICRASSQNEAIAPDNVTIRRQTTTGAADRMPIRIDAAVLYIQRARRKLYEMAFNFESDRYLSPEMTMLARHITRPKLAEIAYQDEPWSVLWSVLDNGTLGGFTYVRDQKVTAWHRHDMGGSMVAVKSIACIPGDGQSELWLVVERVINGAVRRYVEYLSYEFWPDDASDKADACFVDSALKYSGAPATSFTGLDHLEGQTVQVYADGGALPDAVVQAGGVTLGQAASAVTIGLGYTSDLETLDIDVGAAAGSAMGARRRIDRIVIKMLNSLGFQYGRDGQMDRAELRLNADPMNASPPLLTGDKIVQFPKGWDTECRVRVLQDQPLPCTVAALAPRMTTND